MNKVTRRTRDVARKIYGRVARAFENEFLPNPRLDTDLFLVEFPKSGVTWLSFVFANLHVQMSQHARAITLFNLDEFVHDVQSVRRVSVHSDERQHSRIFKSHAPYMREYRKIIYLVRDPRDVMVSYWKFLTGLGQWSGTLEELVWSQEFGISAWKSHVIGWLDNVDPAVSFAIVRYEDLLMDVESEMKSLCSLLGIQVNDSQIRIACERSSIERLRVMEAEYQKRNPTLRSLEFFRKGDLGGGRIALSNELKSSIEAQLGPLMEKFGYATGRGNQGMLTR